VKRAREWWLGPTLLLSPCQARTSAMPAVPRTRRRRADRHGRPLHSRPTKMRGEKTNLPLAGKEKYGGTTATPWPSDLHGNDTYPQSPTTGARAKQAHTSVKAVGSEDSHAVPSGKWTARTT
jgi:hypothetical protein